MSTWLALAWKFARGANRRGRAIAVAGVSGIAFGVAALLGGLSVVPALQARDARQATTSDSMESGHDDDVLLMERWTTTFHDQPLLIQRIAPVGEAPMPAGLEAFPAPGTIVASPALAAILQGPERDQLTQRISGRLTGEIGEEGLVEPHELRAYVGAAADDLHRAVAVTRFGAPDPYDTDPGVMVAIAAATAGVIMSVLMFVWTVTRLGAASRESRLAGLRLLGVTPTEARLIVALEVGVGAVIGALLGVGLFGVGRYLVPWDTFLPGNAGLFPGDLRPQPWSALIVLVLVPLAAVAVAWITLRRAVGKPMEVTRRAPVRSSGILLGATALALGIACWIVLATAPGWARAGDYVSPRTVVILGGFALTTLGVIGVAPWLGTRGAAMMMRSGGLGAWFASRRLAFDRRSAGRITAGVVAVVFAAGTSTGMLHLYAAQFGLIASADNLQATTLLAYGGRDGQAARVGGDHGVVRTVPVSFALAKIPGWGTESVAVADCAALGSVLQEVPPCDAGVWRTTLDVQIDPRKEAFTIRGPGDVPDATFTIPPEDAPTIDLSFLGGYPLFMIDRAALDPALASGLESFEALLGADGDPDTAEVIRESLGAGSDVAITTPTMFEPYGWSQEAAIARVVQWAASVAVAIAAASLLVALVGAVQERRRPLAVLAATGVGAGTIRRSYLLQAMLPLGAGVLLALACAGVVVRAFAIVSYDGAGAWAAMLPGLRIAAVALLGGLVATALTLPAIGRSIAPEALHAE